MTYKRLTPDEKAAILAAAGQGETIKDLATKFGVSENTIRRTLKTGDAEAEVTPVANPEPTPKAPPQIVKRAKSEEPKPELAPEPAATSEPSPELITSPRKPITRRKRASSQSESSPETPESETPSATEPQATPSEKPVTPKKPIIAPVVTESSELAADDLEDDEDELTGLAGEDLEDFGDDDFEEDEDDSDSADDPEEAAEMLAEEPSPAEIAIFPLEAAVLPRPCYLVIDTRSELLARPLAEFQGLGHAAQEEEQQKTLPIFESRAVAMRFSQRNQRIYKNSESILRKTVVKVPDGNVLLKTSSYLQGKGITRLLIHGQVYALE